MRRKTFKIVVVCLAFLCTAQGAHAGPSLQNGDFSEGLTGWDTSPDWYPADSWWSPTIDGGGYALLELDRVVEDFPIPHPSNTLRQIFTLDPDSSILSFDVAMSVEIYGPKPFYGNDFLSVFLSEPGTLIPLDPDPGYVNFYYLDSFGHEETVADVIGNTVSLDVSAWAGDEVQLAFVLYGCSDGRYTSVAVDNVHVSVIPAPSALLLGLVGSGMVGFWHRFRNVKATRQEAGGQLANGLA